MSNTDKVVLRRKNLKNWFYEKTNPIPVKDKSLISQLVKGKISFGEKVSRRLDQENGMPFMYLDIDHEANSIFPRTPNIDDFVLIPQYTALGSCGVGELNEHVEVTEGMVFKRAWLKRKSLAIGKLMVIYADGDSMFPTIEDGDVLLIDLSQVNAIEGKVYAALRGGNGMSIKRLFRSPDGSGWTLRSDNQNKALFPDLHPLENDVIIGRVVWHGGDGGL